jgi:hypothetical protein
MIEALIILAVLVVIALTVTIARRLRRQIPFQLPGLYEGTTYAGSTEVDPRFIAECLKKAEEVLLKHSPWSSSQLRLVISSITVLVVDHEAWIDQHGTDQLHRLKHENVIVNSKLEGLCHELAHRCQWRLDTLYDDNHLTWSISGIWNAVYEYEAWLNGTRFISSSR